MTATEQAAELLAFFKEVASIAGFSPEAPPELVLDRLRKEVDGNAHGIHSCSNECQRPMCVIRRQHKAYRQALEIIIPIKWDEPEACYAMIQFAKQALETK